MAQSWIGHIVSIECGDMGTYQGHVVSVNNSEQTITLGKAFRNGIPYNVPEVIIDALNIQDLKIIKTPSEIAGSRNSNQNARTQVEGAKSTHSYRKSPDIRKIREQSKRGVSPGARGASPGTGEYIRNRSYSASESRDSPKRQQSTPRKIEGQQRRKQREDCFSTPVDSYIEEFDFEKNLAMFDKQAVFEEIDSHQPIVVKAGEAKYRCDENVIPSAPPVLQQIKLPQNGSEGGNLYVTDSDLVVPSISVELRERLFEQAEKLGYTAERQLETVGRSATEMVLNLLGGVHRLNPKNSHQRPTVVIMCGPHMQGAQGINCARHLANRHVNTIVYMPNFVQLTKYITDELVLYSQTSGKRVTSISELPQNPVDIIVSALDNKETAILQEMAWYQSVVTWANDNKAPVLAIDPPLSRVTVNTKWSLSLCLPLSYPSTCGALYLCDMGFGKRVFTDLGLKYMSPFGHKFVIPIHAKDS